MMRLVFLIVGSLWLMTATAELYRYKNAQGQWVFTNNPTLDKKAKAFEPKPLSEVEAQEVPPPEIAPPSTLGGEKGSPPVLGQMPSLTTAAGLPPEALQELGLDKIDQQEQGENLNLDTIKGLLGDFLGK